AVFVSAFALCRRLRVKGSRRDDVLKAGRLAAAAVGRVGEEVPDGLRESTADPLECAHATPTSYARTIASYAGCASRDWWVPSATYLPWSRNRKRSARAIVEPR